MLGNNNKKNTVYLNIFYFIYAFTASYVEMCESVSKLFKRVGAKKSKHLFLNRIYAVSMYS